MSQMSTFQVITVYTERSCLYVSVRCNLKRNISWTKWTHCKLILCILRESVCMWVRCNCLKRNTLTLISMLLFWGMNNLHVEQGKISCLIAAEIRDNRTFKVLRFMNVFHVNCVDTALFPAIWGKLHSVSKTITHNCHISDVMSNYYSVKSLVNSSDAWIFWTKYSLRPMT